jgi:hypothetical protein
MNLGRPLIRRDSHISTSLKVSDFLSTKNFEIILISIHHRRGQLILHVVPDRCILNQSRVSIMHNLRPLKCDSRYPESKESAGFRVHGRAWVE